MSGVKKCFGTSIYLMGNILTPEQCEYLRKEIDSVGEHQVIITMPLLSNQLWGFIRDKISAMTFRDELRNKSFRIMGIGSDMTMTRAYSPLGKHKDRADAGVFFKLAFYLNDLSRGGGTNFYDGENITPVENKMGRGILFDISLEHGSQSFPSGETKYMLGARPIISYTQ